MAAAAMSAIDNYVEQLKEDIADVKRQLTTPIGDERRDLLLKVMAEQQASITALLRQKLVLMQPAGAGARQTATADGPVIVRFKDADGQQQERIGHLWNGRLNKKWLDDQLASMMAVLLTINNAVPNFNPEGYSIQRFKPGQVVEITTMIRPGIKPWWHRLFSV